MTLHCPTAQGALPSAAAHMFMQTAVGATSHHNDVSEAACVHLLLLNLTDGFNVAPCANGA